MPDFASLGAPESLAAAPLLPLKMYQVKLPSVLFDPRAAIMPVPSLVAAAQDVS